jgi:small subunit ribosomal protein S5
MAEFLEETQGLESTTVGIYRTAAVAKGGRRFSFAALVVVGDRRGSVGIGYGKATGVPAAIEKAQKDAKKRLVKISIKEGTIPHLVQGKFGASSVRLIPAAPGTGVVAGATVRAVLEMVGIKDCLSKCYGSSNQKNLVKATMQGLERLRRQSEVSELRGMEIGKTRVDEILEAGARYMPVVAGGSREAVKGPVNTVGQKSRGGSRGGRGGSSGGGRGRGRGESDGGGASAGAEPTGAA